MQVGDYVRTKNKVPFEPSQIAKITDMKKDEGYKNQYFITLDHNLPTTYNFHIYSEDVIKSSSNIIDLLEVGDIITFKEDDDVYRIASVPDKEIALDVFYLEKNYDGETEDIWVEPRVIEEAIKSVVTKEQFEEMEYKI